MRILTLRRAAMKLSIVAIAEAVGQKALEFIRPD